MDAHQRLAELASLTGSPRRRAWPGRRGERREDLLVENGNVATPRPVPGVRSRQPAPIVTPAGGQPRAPTEHLLTAIVRPTRAGLGPQSLRRAWSTTSRILWLSAREPCWCRHHAVVYLRGSSARACAVVTMSNRCRRGSHWSRRRVLGRARPPGTPGHRERGSHWRGSRWRGRLRWRVVCDRRMGSAVPVRLALHRHHRRDCGDRPDRGHGLGGWVCDGSSCAGDCWSGSRWS